MTGGSSGRRCGIGMVGGLSGLAGRMDEGNGSLHDKSHSSSPADIFLISFFQDDLRCWISAPLPWCQPPGVLELGREWQWGRMQRLCDFPPVPRRWGR